MLSRYAMPPTPDSEPPPGKYTLRQRPAEIPKTDSAGHPVNLGDLLDSAAASPRPHANAAPPAPRPPVPAANDVYAMLRDSRSRKTGGEIAPPRRSNRRRNDFFLLLVLGCAALAGAAVLIGPNPLVLLFTAGAAFAYTLALGWIMWFVMDRY